MPGFDDARALAETLLAAQRPDLWLRAQRAAARARELGEESGLDTRLLMTAAVLHPIGESPVVRRTGDAAADAARFLQVRGHDPRVVALVAGRETGPVADALLRCVAEATDRRAPPPEVVAQASAQPGGWVYEIDGTAGPDDAVAPEAIRGAWPVGEDGRISGGFVANPNHRPAAES